jgi:hypothetical protein
LKVDTERFRNIAAGVQSAVLALAVLIGGGWTLYTFWALHETSRRTAELPALERSLTERGIPDITVLSEQMPGDGYHSRYLVVTVAVTNRGNRTEKFNWATGGLTAAHTGVPSTTAERAASVTPPAAGACLLARRSVRNQLPAAIRGIATFELRNQQKRRGTRNGKAEFGRLAPQPGHVSNFCGLKRGPLEPFQLLLDQWHPHQTGTRIQTGRPGEILLERLRTIIFEQGIR